MYYNQNLDAMINHIVFDNDDYEQIPIRHIYINLFYILIKYNLYLNIKLNVTLPKLY